MVSSPTLMPICSAASFFMRLNSLWGMPRDCMASLALSVASFSVLEVLVEHGLDVGLDLARVFGLDVFAVGKSLDDVARDRGRPCHYRGAWGA